MTVISRPRMRERGSLRQRGPEAIDVRERRHSYFPQRFVWRGHNYHVDAVERCWTVSRRGGQVQRHYFRVRCAEGTFEVYQDVQHNTWHISR